MIKVRTAVFETDPMPAFSIMIIFNSQNDHRDKRPT